MAVNDQHQLVIVVFLQTYNNKWQLQSADSQIQNTFREYHHT